MRQSIKILLTATVVFSMANTAIAQAKKLAIDKVIGIVGDKIILESDVRNAIFDEKRKGQALPENAECIIIEQSLVAKIMSLQAEKDSLLVTDEDIEGELDLRVRQFVVTYGTTQAVEEIAGKTIYQLKNDLRDNIKERMLGDNMRKKIIENVKITPTEVSAFYNKIPKDSLPFFESELEVGQIIIFPKANKEIDDYLFSELAKYKKQVESKISTFEQLEKTYSEDLGTKQNGGILQINRNDRNIDPVFLSTAFRLKNGEISQPVKSKFGYHIIKMVQKNGDDAVVSHILRIPTVTDGEIKEAVAKLDTVRSKIIAKTMSFTDAAARYCDEDIMKNMGAFLLNSQTMSPYLTIDQLDPDLLPIISKLKTGEISQPTSFIDRQQGKKGVKLVYLKSKTEPHRMNLRDDYSKISQVASDEKKAEAMNKWVKEKLPTYYIMIDDKYLSSCSHLQTLFKTSPVQLLNE